MDKENYAVFVQVDTSGRITAINSDAFLTDTTGWIKVDEGMGDRFHHAQGNYLPQPLKDGDGVYRYKLEGGKLLKRTSAEMELDRADQMAPAQQPDNTAERLAQVEQQLDMLLEGATGDE